MQGSANVGAPSYIQGGHLPRPHPVRVVGGIFLFLAMLLCGIGGALANYCVLDDYGLCYYPDAGVGWGMIGLGIVLFIVAAVFLLVGRKRVSAAAPPALQVSQPVLYSPPTQARAYPGVEPAPLPPPAATTVGQFCGICGQPASYIAQYGRYYCYACARYT